MDPATNVIEVKSQPRAVATLRKSFQKPYPAEMGSHHSPENDPMRAAGVYALDNGLGPTPTSWDSPKMHALAVWKSARHGVVIFLDSSRDHEEAASNVIWHAFFRRAGTTWECQLSIGSDLSGSGETAETAIAACLDGRAIVKSGGSFQIDPEEDSPALTLRGWHSSEVVNLTLIQGGDSIPFGADGHLGAWVVGSESAEPWQVEARDPRGKVVAVIDKDSW